MSIKECRERAEKTVADVAEHMGVSLVSVYGWENGDYTPKPDKLLRLAKYLNVTVEELLSKQEGK